jgi:mRNA interferase MazF
MPKIPLQGGDVVLVDLRGAEGGEKQGERPCVVVQNNKGNEVSPLTMVVPLTDEAQFKKLSVQVLVPAKALGAGAKDSVAECGHIRTVDRDRRISKKLTTLSAETMGQIDKAIRVSLGI